MHIPEPIPSQIHDEQFAGVSYHIRGELVPELPRSYTLPRDRFGVSKRGPLAPLVRAALASLGASLPRRIPALLYNWL